VSIDGAGAGVGVATGGSIVGAGTGRRRIVTAVMLAAGMTTHGPGSLSSSSRSSAPHITPVGVSRLASACATSRSVSSPLSTGMHTWSPVMVSTR
jgi:hypothetical protein